jgi:superfamily II DNA or RNA helicase
MSEAEEIMRDIYPNVEYRRMHSRMPDNEVKETREWFQNTDEGYLLAVNMISEGAHYRGVNTIIMFRRTQSSLVFNQQLGRIITLARDEDPQAIVFDLVNNAENLDTEKRFSASLRECYAQRKIGGGKEKSEQIIIEDYAEAISDVLRKISMPWTEEEKSFLQKFYPQKGIEYCADKLNKKLFDVRRQVITLGLSCNTNKIKQIVDKPFVRQIVKSATKPKIEPITNNLIKPTVRRILKNEIN